MIRLHDQGAFYRATISADETHRWATRPGDSWPCSAVSGRPLSVTLDKSNGDLVGVSPDGIPGDELNAILADLVAPRAAAKGWDCH